MNDLILTNPTGETEGIDPRLISREKFEELGFEAKPLLQVIRAKCMDCCGYQQSEVKKCTAVTCDLWVYRMGKNPFRKPMSEERRQQARDRLNNR